MHSGFLTAYDSVRPAVLSVLGTLLEGEGPRSWQVYLTGHSLGGALATLCAWDCAHRRFARRGGLGLACQEAAVLWRA